jgi:ABC-type nitrate/sulfonate/bicarbonate transport system substrate-binding protein
MKLSGLRSFWASALFVSLTALMTGCPPAKTQTDGKTGKASGKTPVFSLAWSEYPSWSVFYVADELGLINGKKGEMGEIEKKYNVDIVLKLLDYDSCITAYGGSAVDAVCITNMDILTPSLSRTAVAILPTSTSRGGDALIVDSSIKNIKDLKGTKIYGLSKSVSEYTFVRNLELLGEKESDYNFTSKGPDAAAIAMQQKQVKAIVVWNPFVLSTLDKRKDCKVLFDSSTIPEEIIDMVVVAADSLKKEGGDRFAKAVCASFYAINKRLADPKLRKETLKTLSEKFASLDNANMEKVVKQTLFYKSAAEGSKLFTGKTLPETMKKVISFCEKHEMIEKGKKVKIDYGAKAKDSNLRFDDSFMKALK